MEKHRHIHLTIPNVCYNRKTDSFHRINPKIDHKIIKDCWKRALKKNGLWVDVPDHLKPDCYIQFVEFADRNKVIHRLSYCCRRPVEDLADNVIREDITEDMDRDFVLFLLDYTPRIINLGFLVDLKRFGYSRKRRSMICPICGGEMYIVRNEFGGIVLFDRPPPDIPVLCRNRAGIWEGV